MLAKSLSFLAGADAAGIVLGAQVPIILTSRADSVLTRLASCAVAVLVAQARRESRQGRGVTAMADAILVLNAGSSSLKFSAFDAGSDKLPLMLKGQIEGLYTAPRFVAKDAQGANIGSKSWDKGTEFGHSGAIAYLVDFLQSHSGGDKLVAVGHRVVHGGQAFTQAVRVNARCDRCAREAEPAGAAAPAPQPEADRDRREAAPRAAAGRLLRHRLPSRAARGGAGLRAAAVDHRSRRAALRLPRPVLRVHRQRAAAVRSEGRAPAAPSLRTSATAAACARWWTAAAWPAPWASPRSTGCRWARAAAISTPASSCT